eukprot:6203094-Pleurochrysis_carterae.AAC.5
MNAADTGGNYGSCRSRHRIRGSGGVGGKLLGAVLLAVACHRAARRAARRMYTCSSIPKVPASLRYKVMLAIRSAIQKSVNSALTDVGSSATQLAMLTVRASCLRASSAQRHRRHPAAVAAAAAIPGYRCS